MHCLPIWIIGTTGEINCIFKIRQIINLIIHISEVLEPPISTLLGETVVETEIDNLKAISEKLEVINLQLAQRKTTRRKFLQWLLISLCAAIVIISAILILINSPYLGWDYSSPETAVLGVAFHSLEWLFVSQEAITRGADVTAVVRGENQSTAKKVIQKDLFVMDGADFPEIFKPLASNMGKALDELRTRTDVKWTYISPAGDFQADGAKTGKYILGSEELTLNSKGESVISYADYAVAMVDEALNGNHVQQRISVVAE